MTRVASIETTLRLHSASFEPSIGHARRSFGQTLAARSFWLVPGGD